MLKVLRRIIQEVNVASDLSQALSRVVEQVCDAIQADACQIFLVDDERGEYVLVAAVGLGTDRVGHLRVPLGKGLVGFVAEREEPVNIEDLHQHPAFYIYSGMDVSSFHGYLGAPMIYRGELLGVIAAHHHELSGFAEEEEAFLVTLAIQLGAELIEALSRGGVSNIFPKHKRQKKTITLNGISGSLGVAVGHAVVVYPRADLDAVPDREIEDPQTEIALFKKALDAARKEIHILQARAQSSLLATETLLFDVYLQILDSPSLIHEVSTEINRGQWAQSALRRVVKQHVLQFESLEDEYLKERATDFRDLGRRILAQLQSETYRTIVYPKKTILVSEEVNATALMEVPDGRLQGVISASGSSNSHVAILARALGVPAVMGISGAPISLMHKKEVVVDGYNGHVYVCPTQALKKEFKNLALEEQQLDAELGALRELPAKTTDGHQIALLVNTGLLAETGLSLSVGAEGVGLYRSEMPFMVRNRFPSEEEQRVMYKQLLNTFSPRQVVMRTLDIGGDKSLPYFPIAEENPFLGWRGIRVTLDQPEIFLQQVRAMLQSSEGLSNLAIMLPMVCSISEVDGSKRLMVQAFNELKAEGLDIIMPPLGVMVEIPSAVYLADELAHRVDFLSVGTNDLIQYLLAVDRNNPRVADCYDGLHPAVIRALKQTVDAGNKAGKPVGICGELASDPLAAVLLLAMGFASFSMNARSLPRIKCVIRTFSKQKAKDLLQDVLAMDDVREIRNYMETALDNAGLGGLIRAGR